MLFRECRRTQRSPNLERKCRKTQCNLLKLPTEIRQPILKDSLFQSRPIHDFTVNQKLKSKQATNDHFTPAILRTCRQICQEGRQWLYENIFDIQMFQAHHHSNISFLHHNLALDSPPPEASALAHHFSVTIHGSYPASCPELIDVDESFDHRHAVHQLCGLIAERGDQSTTTISINVAYQRDYEE